MNDLDQKRLVFSIHQFYTARFDPHTNYFAPGKERFDVSISGKLEVGARLQKKK
jgi:carboxyl-terminal processing protease